MNDHGEVAKGGIIAVIKESQAWHHETYHGEGTLLESQRNRFYAVLNGSPSTLDCGGLINSWLIAQNIIAQYYGIVNPPAQTINVTTKPAYLSLYYGSSSFNNVTLPGVSTVNQAYLQSVGSWEVPKYPSGSYLENFFTLTNARPAAQLTPFI